MIEPDLNYGIDQNQIEYITHTNFYLPSTEKKRRQKENVFLRVYHQENGNNLATVNEETSINNSFENNSSLICPIIKKNSSLVNIIGGDNLSNFISPVCCNFKRFRFEQKIIKSNSQKLFQNDHNNKKKLLERMNENRNIQEKFQQFLNKVKGRKLQGSEMISKNINYSIFDPTDLMIRFTKKYNVIY